MIPDFPIIGYKWEGIMTRGCRGASGVPETIEYRPKWRIVAVCTYYRTHSRERHGHGPTAQAAGRGRGQACRPPDTRVADDTGRVPAYTVRPDRRDQSATPQV